MITEQQLDALLDDLPRHDARDEALAQVLDRVADESAEVPARRRGPPAWILGLAAVLLVGLGFLLRPAPTPDPRLTLKGDADVPASVELGLSLLRDGVPLAMPEGAKVRPSDALLFRYTVDRDGFVYLFRQASPALEVFSGAAATAGTHHLEAGGEVQGYALDTLRGEQVFGVAWSAEPWPGGAAGPVPPEDFDRASVDLRAVHVGPP